LLPTTYVIQYFEFEKGYLGINEMLNSTKISKVKFSTDIIHYTLLF